MALRAPSYIRWTLAAFGVGFLGVGLWLLVDDSSQRDVARAAALPAIDAAAVAQQAAGTAVLLEGRLVAVGPVGREGFVAFEHERYLGTEQSGANKGRARWMQLPTEAPPVAVESGGVRAAIVNSGYGLRSEPHQWQSSELPFYNSIGDCTERLRGFKVGDGVTVDGRVVMIAVEGGAAGVRVIEATVLAGGDRAAYLADLRSGIMTTRILGGIFTGLGVLVTFIGFRLFRRRAVLNRVPCPCPRCARA